MFERVLDIVLPPLQRRTPELAGLEGWLAQCALLLGLDRYAAGRRWRVKGNACCTELANAYQRINGKPATHGEGRMLAHLHYGGIVEAEREASLDNLIAAVLVVSMARGEIVHLACTQSQRMRAEAIIAKANIADHHYHFLDDKQNAFLRESIEPRVLVGTADALTLHVLRAEALTGTVDFKSIRLIGMDIHQQYLREGHREVTLQKIVERPELVVRTHTAVVLSQNFQAEIHFTRSQSGEVTLNNVGRVELEKLVAKQDSWWAGAKRRVNLIELILYAMHSLKESDHYTIENGRVSLRMNAIPESIRTAVGDIDLALVLHRLNGLSPPPFKVVAAQSSLLRVARRYANVSGVVTSGAMANKDTRRLLGVSVLHGRPIAEIVLAARICTDHNQLIKRLVKYLQKYPNTLIVSDTEEALEAISQGLIEQGQAFGKISADATEVAETWLGLVCELNSASSTMHVKRGYRQIVQVGGPSTALERRTLRGQLSTDGIAVHDLLHNDHDVLKQVGQNALSNWLLLHLPAFMQSRWLNKSLRGLEKLERSSRIGLLRNEVLSRSHYAFLGEN